VRIPLVFDMETRDPDDALTLCLLASHPAVELRAVTVTPGTPAQLGVVGALLERLAVVVPLGARAPDSPADAVSPFHRDWLGALAGRAPDAVAHELLAATIARDPATVLVTGAPLHNLRMLLRHHPEVALARWIAQGGFAGDNLVEPAARLPKFAGRTTCESFNFGGDKAGTQAALASPRIARRELVSKNVTHGVAWDAALHTRLAAVATLTPGVRLMWEAMDVYLRQRPEGKLLHDPLAACAVFAPEAFRWREVEVTYAAGQWGAVAASGTNTFITVALDWPRALAAMVGVAPPELG
jgi:inosine-uridine nucleoside N-ribohydrolase